MPGSRYVSTTVTLLMAAPSQPTDDAPMMTLGIDLDGYVRHLVREGAAARTIQQRVPVVRKFLLRVGDNLGGQWSGLPSITADHVAAFLNEPGYSGYTRSTYYSHLRSLFRWAVADGLIKQDPTEHVRRPSMPTGKPRPLTDDEARLVLDSAVGDMYTWLLLSMFAGLRAHEIAKVRGEDVTERSIFVLGKGRQEAFVPTHPLVWAVAQRYPVTGWWFPSKLNETGHITGGTISHNISGLFRSLGIDGSSHRGRHVYGTRLLRAGANIRVVQECMRHRSLSSTMVYTAVAEDEMRAAVLALSA